MIRTFLFLAIRNFLKNKGFVVINVLGLGTALGCCIVAYLNYRFESDYNKMHRNYDEIYKINVRRDTIDSSPGYSISPVSLGPSIASGIAGIEHVVRFARKNMPVRCNENNKVTELFIEDIGFADKDFLRMFTFPMKWGDSTAFKDRDKILLSEETSEKFYGHQNPLGKTITVYNEQGKGIVMTIGGVFKKMPYNSIIEFEAVTLYENYLSIFDISELDWKNWTAATFLQIPDLKRAHEIENILSNYIDIQNKNLPEWKIKKYDIQSLKDFTKDSHHLLLNWVGTDLHPAQTITLIIMALLLLLLACFNYLNTAIAFSNKRLKEIGIRKAFGSNRFALVIQFIGENFLICFLALIVSLYIGKLLGNEYNKMISFNMIGDNFILDTGVWKFLIAILIFTTILSSFYPAFYISSFNPIKVIQGTVKFSGADIFSRLLLILQFSISLIGLVSSIAFAQNARFQRDFDFGYNKDQIITIPAGSNSNLTILKREVENNPNVIEAVATGDHIPLNSVMGTAKYIDHNEEVRLLNTNADYCKFMDIKIVAGRDLTEEYESSDRSRSALINESLVRKFRWEDPIGKSIKIDTQNLVIVGVFNDYYKNLYDPIVPTLMRLAPKDQLKTLLVKGDKSNLLSLNEQLKKEWEKLFPNAIYEGIIGDMNFVYSQSNNKSIIKVFNFLSVVAVFLSLIALYTLVSLNILKRTKEIGIRKVLGASSLLINYAIIKPFFTILILASIVGGYGGYILSRMLLNNVWLHHIHVNARIISLPVAALLIIALITLSYKVYYTLWKNPINMLSYE
jgi:ABC-type antimicrobial peptide transport system permease subunit